jgi:hypothetical protein
MEFDIELAKCKQQQQQQQADEIEKLKDSRKVDLYQFILHLYIQQFYSIDLKSSFMSREECVFVFQLHHFYTLASFIFPLLLILKMACEPNGRERKTRQIAHHHGRAELFEFHIEEPRRNNQLVFEREDKQSERSGRRGNLASVQFHFGRLSGQHGNRTSLSSLFEAIKRAIQTS